MYSIIYRNSACHCEAAIKAMPKQSACHSEPFVCHPERSEGSQGKLREESQLRDPSALPQDDTSCQIASYLLSMIIHESKYSTDFQ